MAVCAVAGLSGCGGDKPRDGDKAKGGANVTTTDANAGGGNAAVTAPPPPGSEAIPLKLPSPRFSGTPKNVPPGTRVIITKGPIKPRPPFYAPKGAVNVAAGKPVAASDMEPVIGKVTMVTDGNKEANEDAYVELGPGVQWVQVDLGKPFKIYAVVVWHEHKNPIVYKDVVVQVAKDKDFIDSVKTIYNNDDDNSAGQGIGEEWGFFETNEGLLIDAKGVTSRFVRLYSNGNTGDDLNRYTEVEVYAVPAE
jgi:hypothetical protein